MQTIAKNAGAEGKAFAIMLKGVAASEAAINSYLAFTKAIAAYPPPMGTIMGGVVMAAGLAKQAAILSTPISAETGLSNYTVPDIRQYRNDGYPVKAQAGETVSVTPRGGGAGGNIYIQVQVGAEKIVDIVQKNINTGKINISDRQLGKGVFA
jgi:hypothetical protein